MSERLEKTYPAHAHPHLDALRGSHAVKAILGLPGFRRLYGARLASQWSDGMFQASLAGTVLFNPQHAATPADMAASFAVMLLPYSLIGPFVGVLLDRYSRRHLMTIAQLLRAVAVVATCVLVWAGYQGFGFYALALVSLSLSRFFLSGLSAALPHVVPRNTLVTANAFSTTSGTVVSILGGACSIALLSLTGKSDHGYAVVAATSLLGPLLSAWLMSLFAPAAIGPDHATRQSAQRIVDVLRGVVEGARHIYAHREVAGVLTSIAAHRFIFGAVGVSILLQFKNHVPAGGLVPRDIAGIGMALGIGGLGALIAAAITPAVARAIGKNAWIVIAYGTLGTASGLIMLIDRPWSMIVASFCLGFAGQAVKVCADTIAQETIDESFQGRTFAVYDTTFNVSFVIGVVLAAYALPGSGRTSWFFVSIAVMYAAVAALYRLIALKHEVRR
ncbi:MFS transporter [Cumulibacter manganitolerans]|uniref:MFS transporter n=1 Tax=Cumulibacter manganitolerans TaxID=1884992 RepID=UPI001885BD13|nr:MFS transporter [Cumulibacter manganitolerans]